MARTTRHVHRTTIDIDLDAFEGARGELGTRGYRDTINEALRAVERAARLKRGAAAIRAGGIDVVTPKELERLRRSRI